MSTGLNARRATRLTVAKGEESFTRTESMTRWSREGRAAYEAEKEALLFDFFCLFYLCKVFQSGRKFVHHETEICFFSNMLFCISVVFAVLLCRAVLSLSYIQQAYQKKKMIALPGICICVFVTLNRYFYPSTFSTTSARADSSILERYKLCGHKTTPQRYYVATYAVGSGQCDDMSSYWIRQARHTHSMK